MPRTPEILHERHQRAAHLCLTLGLFIQPQSSWISILFFFSPSHLSVTKLNGAMTGTQSWLRINSSLFTLLLGLIRPCVLCIIISSLNTWVFSQNQGDMLWDDMMFLWIALTFICKIYSTYLNKKKTFVKLLDQIKPLQTDPQRANEKNGVTKCVRVSDWWWQDGARLSSHTK